MEAQHRTAVPEEAVLVLAVAADLAADLAASLAGLVAGLVAGLAVVAVVAAVLAVGLTVLTAGRLVPHESRDPACFLASRS